MSRIAILGGTGPEGIGLALRFALSGSDVIVGSRSKERARSVADRLLEQLRAVQNTQQVSAMENSEAAREADLAILAFPYEGVAQLVASLRRDLENKTVIEVINPLLFEGGAFRAAAIEAGSAAEEIQQLLPKSQVVSAFKSHSAEELRRIAQPMRGDVIVCSDHPKARQHVLALAGRIRFLRPVDGGALVNARALESFTALLLNLNRRYRTITSMEILGLPR